MSGTVYLVSRLAIEKGQSDAFKKHARELIAFVRDTQPGTLIYEWYLEQDENACTIVQSFRDSSAFVAHVENGGEVTRQFLKTCRFIQVDFYGDVSDDLREMAKTWSAGIVPYHDGFSRM